MKLASGTPLAIGRVAMAQGLAQLEWPSGLMTAGLLMPPLRVNSADGADLAR